LEIFLIAIGLAMDAFAVSISSAILIQHMRLRHALRIAVFFGVFQGIMPLIGWLGISLFKDSIESFDHWIAFALLALIGGKMIKDSFNQECDSFDPLDVHILFLLAIATSVDALAVGVTFSLLDSNIYTSALLIGVITFFISLTGTLIGDRLGTRIGKKAEVFGGVTLILIGGKILLEHLFAITC